MYWVGRHLGERLLFGSYDADPVIIGIADPEPAFARANDAVRPVETG
jgi:hypothetical protein